MLAIHKCNMTYKFELTKDRSAACNKYAFEFIDNSNNAVVPVLQRYQTGEYRIIGTGSYFIRPNIFITASHVFEGDDINSDDGFYVVLEGAPQPIAMTHKFSHEEYDLAIFYLEDTAEKYLEKVNPLAVMNSPLIESEIVALFGYSHSIIDPSSTIEEENGDVNQEFRLRSKWEVGGVLNIHESGRGHVKGQCFETSVLAEGRDSGAPMFNSNGFLVGLLSTSMHFDSGLPNSICTSILQLADIPINGIPIKELWVRKPRAAYCKVIG